MSDLISRQAAIDAIQTWGLIDGLSEGEAIEILADEEKVPSAQTGIDPQKLLKAIYKHPLLGEYEKAVMTEIVDKLQEGENE